MTMSRLLLFSKLVLVNRSVLFCIGISVALFSFGSISAEPLRILKPEDVASVRDVDEPNLSPDGNSVVYVVTTFDLANDKQPSNLWLAKWDGSENRPLTFGDKMQSHPRLSPDGKWIAFLSSREDENENDDLWILSTGGGEAE